MSRSFALITALALVLSIPATRALGEKEYEVSLVTGITGLVKLGDSLATVKKNILSPSSEIDLKATPGMADLGFVQALAFKKLGMKLYFNRTGVTLIVMQEPFVGTIKSKDIKLFAFTTPPVDDWESYLIRKLGNPELRASSGRLGSQALFYSWGDISFNRMGANELALYRDAKIAKYRQQNNFGRELVIKIDD